MYVVLRTEMVENWMLSVLVMTNQRQQ